MLATVGILLATIVVVLIEKKNIKKEWDKKEIAVFGISLLIGTSLCIAWVFQVELLNPLKIIGDIYRPISEPITSYITQFK
jgi:hypothetical protein